jgi:hypothetical protein
MNRFNFALGVVATAAAAACSAASADTFTSSTSHETKASDAGPLNGDGSINASDDGGASNARRFGYVWLNQYFQTSAEGGTSVQVSPEAMFPEPVTDEELDGGISIPCTTTTAGSCTMQECAAAVLDPGARTSPNDPTEKLPNAGTISLHGQNEQVTLTPDSQGRYFPSSFPSTGGTNPFAPGETIDVMAAGADVPGFDQSLKMAGLLTLTAPDPSSGTVSLDTSHDLVVAWTGSDPGDATVEITNGVELGAGHSVDIQCKVAASVGTFTIPTSMLSKLDDPNGNTALYLSTHSDVTFSAGNYDMTVTTANTVTTMLRLK